MSSNNTIYLITNTINGKTYVGKTKLGIEERFKKHYYKHKTGQTYLYNAMRKYGFDNFKIEAIESEVLDLDIRECFWIDHLKPNYNMTSGGEGGDTSSSPNYINAMKEYHKKQPKERYATYGMSGKKQSNVFLSAIKKSNSCPVMCDGIEFASVGEAQDHFKGISVRKRLDNDRYPNFYRLRDRTLRK